MCKPTARQLEFWAAGMKGSLGQVPVGLNAGKGAQRGLAEGPRASPGLPSSDVKSGVPSEMPLLHGCE